MDIKDKFCGCLLGLAIGDALGMPFEGWSSASIKRQWKEVGTTSGPRHSTSTFKPFLPSPFRELGPGQYTDDTLMALCHVRSLIEKRGVEPEDISKEFIEWYDSGNLRGIGATTAYAIKRLKRGYKWQESGATGEYAAGNGGAMRIAPVGLFYHDDLTALKEAVRKAVVITHNNSEAVAGALAVAYLVAKAVRNEMHPDTAIQDTINFIGPCKVSEKLQRAGKLLNSDATPEKATETLGTSGYVVETVASAVFCFLYSPEDFYTTIVNAVEGGKDSDTTAAVAGAISGSYNGIKGIPEDWLENVENSNGLQDLANKLYLAWREK